VIHARSALLFVVCMASSCLAQTRREMIITTPVRVEAFVVARNGKIAAGWGNDGRVRMWNLTSRQVLRAGRPRQGTALVRSIANHDAPTPRDPWCFP